MMFSYELNVSKDGDDIVLSQIVDGDVNKITLSSSMIEPLCKELRELNNLEIQLVEKEEKKESSAKERKEEINFDNMELYDDGDRTVVLTEELIVAGMTGGIGINKKQQEILGIETLKSGWKKELIGRAIPMSVYEKYVSLKGGAK